MLFPQLITVILIFLVILGTLISPELSTYGTQLIALLLLFYFVLEGINKKRRREQAVRAVEDEETLLFVSTYLKPKLENLIDLTHHEENQEIIRKQLQLTKREVDHFLEDKEKELEK